MFKKKLIFYKFVFFLPSIFLLISLYLIFKTFLKKNKKIISLRINRKYFGHFSEEPAILSSYQKQEKGIIPIVSYRKSKGINNKILEKVVADSFIIRKDLINSFLEKIYNYSFANFRLKIDKFYSPLLHPKLETREITYMHLLETEKNFKWRENAQKLIFKKNDNDFKLIIALRTEHFNKFKDVPSQPWRNASINDIVKISKIFCKVVEPKKIYLLSHPENINIIQEKEFVDPQINLIDETKVDVLSLFSKNAYLVNNGNGIGAAALAIGVKTLYIHHTVWQFWHTSHSNALCIPSIFFKPLKNEKEGIEKIIKLAFSTNSILPLDFEKDYYQKGILINKIEDIKEEILIKTLKQFLNQKRPRKKDNILGCEFEYESLKEKIFWQTYIKNMPSKLRKSHKLIKLNISNSYLDSF